MDPQFTNRLAWAGSPTGTDLQDGSLTLYNVSTNDTGLYRCEITRNLSIHQYLIPTHSQKNFTLTVVVKRKISKPVSTDTNSSVRLLILILIHLSGVGSRGQQLQQGAPDFPLGLG